MAGLTDRDYQILKTLSVSSVMNMKQVQVVYDTKRYHYKRVAQLIKENYLVKNGAYLELSQSSADLLGINKPRFKNADVKKLYLPIADLCINSKSIPVISNKEIREKYNLNRKTYFKCALEIDSKDYAVYFLFPDTTKQFITHVQRELNVLAANKSIVNAIVFAYNVEVRKMFSIEQHNGLENVNVLPFPAGIEILNQYYAAEHQARMEEIIGDAEPSDYTFADYHNESGYLANLLLNNAVRIKGLEDFYNTKITSEPVTIICLESQRRVFANSFPKAQLMCLPNNIFYERP